MTTHCTRQLARASAALFAALLLAYAPAQEPPAEQELQVAQPPPFTRWSAKTRWDEAQAVEWGAGYDKLKVAESIEAWKMYLNLYPQAGMANEAAWHITTLTARYAELPKTVAAYEQYAGDFPDGDYAESALWNATYQYMGVPDWDTVYSTYDRFLERFPASPYGDVALNGLASNARTKKRYALAVELYQELLQRYPTSDYCDDAVSGIGGIMAAQYRVEEATEAFLTLAQQYPYSGLVQSGLMQLVLMYYTTGESARAVELGTEFIATYPHSPYASTVQIYMYYASRALVATGQGRAVEMPDPYDQSDPTVAIPREHTEDWEAARRTANMLELTEAVRGYQAFIRDYPTSTYVDDALYGIGEAYAKLQTYVTVAKNAKTPEQLGQVAGNWAWVTEGPAAGDVIRGKPSQSAVDAYLQLARAMPGSDLRDDALYKTAVAYEAVEDWVSAVQAYLILIELFPVSAYAPTAVSRLSALRAQLKEPADKSTVMAAVAAAYPHHDLADDFVYDLGIEALERGDVPAARELFRRYSADYPHRSKAADALFWQARCEQLLGDPRTARGLYANLAGRFLQSGLADDGYAECRYMALGQTEAILAAGVTALAQAAAAAGEPLLGYDAIARDHIVIVAPSAKVIDIRAYNIPDRLEQVYGLLADACGGVPQGGQPLVILVDDKVGAPTPGSPARIPASMAATPPPWRQWYELVAVAFTTDPELAPVSAALPGFSTGLARYAAIQFEEFLFAELGEIPVGAAANAAHLADLNGQKGAAFGAIASHAQSKGTMEKIDANVGMGMVWSMAITIAANPDQIIDWTPVQPLFAQGRLIPTEMVAAAETAEQKSALVTHWINTALARDFTPTLVAWGLPVTPEELQKVQTALAPPPPEG